MLEGKLEEAERWFKQAYESDHHYDHSLANLALLYDLRGEKVRSLEVYRAIVRSNPEVGWIRNNLTAVQSDLGLEPHGLEEQLLRSAVVESNEIVNENITRMERKLVR